MSEDLVISKRRKGFTLAEILAALTIGAMVLLATLGIYSRAEKSAASIKHHLDKIRLPSDVLQLIAEDVDRIIAHGSDTKVTVENRYQSGLQGARLIIERTIFGKGDAKKSFERIIWQSSYDYDYDYDSNSLVLYRGHNGMVLEDRLLDESKDRLDTEVYVPVCDGITFFSIHAVMDEKLQNKWNASSLPHGIEVTISFAEPVETLMNRLEVPEEERMTRTIAIDRTNKIKFVFVPRKDEEDEEGDKGEGKEEDQRHEDEKIEEDRDAEKRKR